MSLYEDIKELDFNTLYPYEGFSVPYTLWPSFFVLVQRKRRELGLTSLEDRSFGKSVDKTMNSSRCG